MEIGVFLPIGNNGWLISETAPRYMPSFELNREITLKAEKYGFDFALSMIKLRGFGGKTEFWEYNLDSFTLMAGLAAVTKRIRLFGTIPTLTIPPAMCARMAATIDSISGGRFGINLITGWQKAEYSQMGLWPGEEHFRNRYEFLTEYVTILRELWKTGVSDFKGKFFQMEDCRVRPTPQAPLRIICAGQSDTGLAFTARHADMSFTFGRGLNAPRATTRDNERLIAATAQSGRPIKSYALIMIIAAETDEAAMAKWQHYKDGADQEAIGWMTSQIALDKTAADTANVKQMANPTSAVNLNMGTFVGSYASIARMLDEMAEVPAQGGVLLTFDDFLTGMDDFGERIQPLMACRRAVRAAA